MNFEEMKLKELREYAKEQGIRGISTMKKEDLIHLLEDQEKAAETAEAESTAEAEKKEPVMTEDLPAERAEPAEEIPVVPEEEPGTQRAGG